MLERFSPRVLLEDGESLLDIKTIQDRLGVRLPSQISAILKSYGGALIFDRSIVFPAKNSKFAGKHGLLDVGLLYGVGDGFNGILQANERYKNELPSGSLAIGEVSGDNIIATDLETGGVFLWLHDEPTLDRAVEFLFPSLDEFFSSLSIREVDEDDEESSGVVSIELDPDLVRELNNRRFD